MLNILKKLFIREGGGESFGPIARRIENNITTQNEETTVTQTNQEDLNRYWRAQGHIITNDDSESRVENQDLHKPIITQLQELYAAVVHGEGLEKELNPLNDLEPLSSSDYWRSILLSIEEIIGTDRSIDSETEPKRLFHLIPEDLRKEYYAMVGELEARTRVTGEHDEREFIDIENDKELETKLETWLTRLHGELFTQTNMSLIEFDEAFENLRQEFYLMQDAYATETNARSIQLDIEEFCNANEFEKKDAVQQEELRTEALKQLTVKYPLAEEQLAYLFDVVSYFKDDKFNLVNLFKTAGEVWNRYGLDNRKFDYAKVVGRGLADASADQAAVLLLQNPWGMGVFWGVMEGLIRFNHGTRIQMADILADMRTRINEDITNSVHFAELEFTQDASFGEIYETFKEGKEAMVDMYENLMMHVIPHSAGLGLTTAGISSVNPILGGIALAGIPFTIASAKKHAKEIRSTHSKERTAIEENASALNSMLQGEQETKVSPNQQEISQRFNEKLNKSDTLTMRRYLQEMTRRIVGNKIYARSMIACTLTAAYMWQTGTLTQGETFVNSAYANRVQGPFSHLIETYYGDLPLMQAKVRKFLKLIQSGEVDMPGGEQEQGRKAVSEVKGRDIVIDNLVATDKEGKHILDLRDQSIRIKQGEFVTITGSSGCGKSTLLRHIAGIRTGDSGKVSIGDTDSKDIQRHGDGSIYTAMSYSNQEPHIFKDMTLRENLMLWVRPEEAKNISNERLSEVLKDLNLGHLANSFDKPVSGQLSGGEKVRIGVARSLIKDSEIMMLDEPTHSLDSQSAAEVRRIITDIRKKYPEKTIICVTHDSELAGMKIEDDSTEKDLSAKNLDMGEINAKAIAERKAA